MTGAMHDRVAPVLLSISVLLASAALAGCPSKASESKDAQAPAQAGHGSDSSDASGPLASLESEPFAQEAWTVEGKPWPMIHWARADVRVSASCRTPEGRLACEALAQLRGAPIEVPKRSLDGRMSAGVKACMQTGRNVLVGRGPSGNEDSFCRFQDGSLLSTGALETYGIRVQE